MYLGYEVIRSIHPLHHALIPMPVFLIKDTEFGIEIPDRIPLRAIIKAYECQNSDIKKVLLEVFTHDIRYSNNKFANNTISDIDVSILKSIKYRLNEKLYDIEYDKFDLYKQELLDYIDKLLLFV